MATFSLLPFETASCWWLIYGKYDGDIRNVNEEVFGRPLPVFWPVLRKFEGKNHVKLWREPVCCQNNLWLVPRISFSMFAHLQKIRGVLMIHVLFTQHKNLLIRRPQVDEFRSEEVVYVGYRDFYFIFYTETFSFYSDLLLYKMEETPRSAAASPAMSDASGKKSSRWIIY